MYDSDTGTVSAALTNSNPTVFSQSTIDQILALTTKDNNTVRFDQSTPDASGNVTVAAGAEVVLVNTSNTVQTVVKPPQNAPVVIFQGRGGVVATINDNVSVPSANQTHVDRVVVGSAGNDRIIVQDAKNTQIILGSGNSSVQAGGGVDTIEAGLGNSSIVGGSGDYAVVKLAGNASNYQVTTQNGHAVVTNSATHMTTDISKIQYVQLDNGKALIFAKDSVEGTVANLYQIAFGRTAEAGGLDYWFDAYRAGGTLKQIATAFTNSAEFSSKAALSDRDFVQFLYQNAFSRAGESAGVDYWVDLLAHGQTRVDLIISFASIALQNQIGTTVNTEATVVGSVTIVTGII